MDNNPIIAVTSSNFGLEMLFDNIENLNGTLEEFREAEEFLSSHFEVDETLLTLTISKEDADINHYSNVANQIASMFNIPNLGWLDLRSKAADLMLAKKRASW